MSLQKTIHDIATGESITRDMTADELAEFEALIAKDKKDAAAKEKANKALADKRQQILDRLGITNDELLTILS